MKTYKILLMGGMGNNLFQITRALSLKNHSNDVILLHYGRYRALINFIIGHENHPDWIDILGFSDTLKIKSKKINIFELLSLIFFYLKKKFKINVDFDLSLEERLNSNTSFDIGYFQNRKHFKKRSQNRLRDSLINYLKIKKNNFVKNTICFHIRGGDFFKKKNNSEFVRIPNNLMLSKHINISKNYNINIITNDLNFLNTFDFKSSKINILSNSPKVDFINLIHCSKMYVSQSSYCFWAVLISKNLYACEIVNIDDWIYKDLL